MPRRGSRTWRSNQAGIWNDHGPPVAQGQKRLLDLQQRGDVLDDNLYTAPGKFGGAGAGTTWLVGSAAEVARWLKDAGISGSRTLSSRIRPTSQRSSVRGRNCYPS